MRWLVLMMHPLRTGALTCLLLGSLGGPVHAGEDFPEAELARLPDDAARDAARALRDAVARNDASALLALAGGAGVRRLGKAVDAKRLARALEREGVAGFLGLTPDGHWRVVHDPAAAPGRFAVFRGGDGYTRFATVERDGPAWRLVEIGSAFRRTRAPERRPDAVIVLVDVSGSMGAYLDDAEIAATAAAMSLPETDLFGVVAFDDTASVLVPLAPRKGLGRELHKLELRPGTIAEVPVGLEAAAHALERVSAERKHVILISDGLASYEGVVEATDEARARGITVTSVGIGPDAGGRHLLELVAERGGGRLHLARETFDLPEIFRTETRILKGHP